LAMARTDMVSAITRNLFPVEDGGGPAEPLALIACAVHTGLHALLMMEAPIPARRQ